MGIQTVSLPKRLVRGCPSNIPFCFPIYSIIWRYDYSEQPPDLQTYQRPCTSYSQIITYSTSQHFGLQYPQYCYSVGCSFLTHTEVYSFSSSVIHARGCLLTCDSISWIHLPGVTEDYRSVNARHQHNISASPPSSPPASLDKSPAFCR